MSSSLLLKNHAPSKRLNLLFYILFCGSALLVLALLSALALLLALGGAQAFFTFGWHFFANVWNPVTDKYGLLAPFVGSVVTALLALAIAVPIAFGSAFWCTMILPKKWSGHIAQAIQLLAAVPSIIFGMWGLFVIVPFIAGVMQPIFFELCTHYPWFNHVFGALLAGAPFGTGFFAAGIVLAIMIAPFMTAVMIDLFKSVPTMLCESAYGLGATRWEVMRFIRVPFVRRGMIGAVVLGSGRALGETMAVTFVIGNVVTLGTSFFEPRSTVASLIALQFPESPEGSLRYSALLALGCLLMLLSAASVALSRIMTKASK